MSIVVVIAAIIELLTLSLISVWFMLAALLVVVLSLFITNVYTQFLIFAILSLILFISTRNVAKKYLNKRYFDSSLAGTEVEIIKKEKENYIVKFKGVLYEALSKKDRKIGSVAVIKEFKGNKIVLED